MVCHFSLLREGQGRPQLPAKQHIKKMRPFGSKLVRPRFGKVVNTTALLDVFRHTKYLFRMRGERNQLLPSIRPGSLMMVKSPPSPNL